MKSTESTIWFPGLLGQRWTAGLVTMSVIATGGSLRSDLVGSSKQLLVFLVAVGIGLLSTQTSVTRRWPAAAFLMAIGLGFVAGMHAPRFPNQLARVPRIAAAP